MVLQKDFLMVCILQKIAECLQSLEFFCTNLYNIVLFAEPFLHNQKKNYKAFTFCTKLSDFFRKKGPLLVLKRINNNHKERSKRATFEMLCYTQQDDVTIRELQHYRNFAESQNICLQNSAKT
ncbi:hypothetical protein BpHYR1_001469 [Brachionus plicatilis]|uniref:Uncharacterized protein n=1 Tax=Brachionus plicatilis TaxID=10195 RepID=A0A3M7PTC9_BRAPC|nr:hypothetical protein BpHYR1_001469 [Brachionus plicatilis]